MRLTLPAAGNGRKTQFSTMARQAGIPIRSDAVTKLAGEIAACESVATGVHRAILAGGMPYPQFKVVLTEYTRLHQLVMWTDVGHQSGSCALRDGLARIGRLVDRMTEDCKRALK